MKCKSLLKKITLLLLLFVSLNNFAQERKVFYGIISDDIGILPNVHILNINTKRITYSNQKGEFSISAKVSDSLKMTSIGYKTKRLNLTAIHFGIQNNQIHLEKEITVLDDVVIKKHNLVGVLSTDVKKVVNKKEVDEHTLKLPNAGAIIRTQAERRLYTAKSSSSGISLDYFLNVLSGRLKKLKKLKKIEDIQNDTKKLESDLSLINHFEKDLLIKDLDVSRFISFCQADKEYQFKRKNEMLFIDFLLRKSKEFKEL